MAFFEFIGEVFMEVLVEGVFGNILRGIFKLVKRLGIVILKVFTGSKSSMKNLDEKYRDSSKPYWIGFTILFMVIFLVVNLL